MDEFLENKKTNIVDFFDKAPGDYWRTIDEIAHGARIDSSVVAKIITTSGEFVRSSYRVRNGEPLFTTRKIFRDRAPFMDKMIGAFKNRID